MKKIMFSITPMKDRAAARRKPKKSPNYFSRREQYRLLGLVGSVMLVLFLMGEAGKPTNWVWLWKGDQAEQAEASEQGPVDNTDAHVDSRLIPPHPDSLENDPSLIFVDPAPPASSMEEEEPREAEEGKDYFPGVDPSLFSEIRDNYFDVRSPKAWYHFLSLLRDAEQEALEDASLRNVGYLQMKSQTDLYRGRLISMKGIILRVEEKKAPKNSHDFERWYRCFFYPEGGPRGFPIIVYCLDLPESFPQEMEMHQKVELTGFFYKMQAYSAKDGANVAPALLAKTLTWNRFIVEDSKLPPWPYLLAGILGVAIMATLIAIWAYRRSEARSQQVTSFSIASKFDSKDLDSLEGLADNADPQFPSEDTETS